VRAGSAQPPPYLSPKRTIEQSYEPPLCRTCSLPNTKLWGRGRSASCDGTGPQRDARAAVTVVYTKRAGASVRGKLHAVCSRSRGQYSGDGLEGAQHLRSLLGDLQAAGYTPMQLSTEITQRLEKFIQDPNVTVTVLAVHPKEVFMLGEIQHVGPVPITPNMSPLQAISAAGGLSPFARAKRIYILREQQGKQIKIPFDYKKAIKNGDLQGLSLYPGDTIVIP